MFGSFKSQAKEEFCKGPNCEGIEHYCEDPSHGPVYFCNCKPARKQHIGHSIAMINIDHFLDCVSQVQQECTEEKRRLTIKAEKCIQKILQKLSEFCNELETSIKKCKVIKQALMSPEKKFNTFNEYIKVIQAPNTLEKTRQLLIPSVKANCFEGLGKELEFPSPTQTKIYEEPEFVLPKLAQNIFPKFGEITQPLRPKSILEQPQMPSSMFESQENFQEQPQTPPPVFGSLPVFGQPQTPPVLESPPVFGQFQTPPQVVEQPQTPPPVFRSQGIFGTGGFTIGKLKRRSKNKMPID